LQRKTKLQVGGPFEINVAKIIEVWRFPTAIFGRAVVRVWTQAGFDITGGLLPDKPSQHRFRASIRRSETAGKSPFRPMTL
jgi:hypothetical protein